MHRAEHLWNQREMEAIVRVGIRREVQHVRDYLQDKCELSKIDTSANRAHVTEEVRNRSLRDRQMKDRANWLKGQPPAAEGRKKRVGLRTRQLNVDIHASSQSVDDWLSCEIVQLDEWKLDAVVTVAGLRVAVRANSMCFGGMARVDVRI